MIHRVMYPVGFASHYQLGKRSANAGTTRMSTTTKIKPFVKLYLQLCASPHSAPRLRHDQHTDGRTNTRRTTCRASTETDRVHRDDADDATAMRARLRRIRLRHPSLSAGASLEDTEDATATTEPDDGRRATTRRRKKKTRTRCTDSGRF